MSQTRRSTAMNSWGRTFRGATWAFVVLGLGWPAMAQSGCGSGVPTIGGSPVPVAATERAFVDPVNGDDLTGAVAGPPFRTIQAAVDALALAVASGDRLGVAMLMPGRYGATGPTSRATNGEIWPVRVPDRVRVQGLDALSVILDGAAVDATSATFSVPAITAPGWRMVTPVFLFGETNPGVFDYSLVSRVTIVDADVGLLVAGSGACFPTVAHSLFMNCRVGLQIHSRGSGLSGEHRPSLVWCTLGACDVGVGVTAELAPGVVGPARAAPALVNLLLKNDIDLQGVECSSVVTSAFAPGRVNSSGHVPPSLTVPASVFDVDAYTQQDLFIGARDVIPPPGAPEPWFTDWRLTHRTLGPTSVPNPAQGPGTTSFPVQPGNGTVASLDFGPDHGEGAESAEGAGTSGPLGPPSGATVPTGSHLGYRAGGVLLVGGTVPGERRFGVDATGIMYDVVHIRWQPPGVPLLLLGVEPVGPLYGSGRSAPFGMLEQPLSLAGVPNWSGFVHLDYANNNVVDWSMTVTPQGSSGYATVNIGLNPAANWSRNFVMQLGWLDPAGGFVASDAQVFTVGQP